MTTQVESFRATTADRGLIQSDRQPIHEAILKFDNGDWIGVSRYHDEDYWVADCAFRANGMPVFSNGVGSRLTAFRTLDPDSEEYAMLEARRLHPAYQHR